MKGGYTGWGLWDDDGWKSSAYGGPESGTASSAGASSDGRGRRNGSDEGGDGKADVGVIVRSGQRYGKGRGKTGR